MQLSNTGTAPSNLLRIDSEAGTLSNNAFSQNSIIEANNVRFYRFTMDKTGNFNAGLSRALTTSDVRMRLIRDANNNGAIDSGEVVYDTANDVGIGVLSRSSEVNPWIRTENRRL